MRHPHRIFYFFAYSAFCSNIIIYVLHILSIYIYYIIYYIYSMIYLLSDMLVESTMWNKKVQQYVFVLFRQYKTSLTCITTSSDHGSPSVVDCLMTQFSEKKWTKYTLRFAITYLKYMPYLYISASCNICFIQKETWTMTEWIA